MLYFCYRRHLPFTDQSCQFNLLFCLRLLYSYALEIESFFSVTWNLSVTLALVYDPKPCYIFSLMLLIDPMPLYLVLCQTLPFATLNRECVFVLSAFVS